MEVIVSEGQESATWDKIPRLSLTESRPNSNLRTRLCLFVSSDSLNSSSNTCNPLLSTPFPTIHSIPSNHATCQK